VILDRRRAENSSAPERQRRVKLAAMVDEARLETTEHGTVATDAGWFVLNARDARWRYAAGRGAICEFEGEPGTFTQVGINLRVLEPGEPMAMYHWEADQEDFLVVAGEALLIAEGQERPLRQWDLVHCPPETKHVIVGAGEEQCVLVAIGARGRSAGPDWGGYPVDDVALGHKAGVEHETNDPHEAYAHVEHRTPTRYRPGWLPD
jgi:uncharacterized cupin superfamily protein